METWERIRYFRKKIIKITQEEFSKKINISRSNLGNIEVGNVSVTDRVIADICSTFSVSEIWLRTGKGEIRQETDATLFASLAKRYDLTLAEQAVAKYCLELSEEQRQNLLQHILNLSNLIQKSGYTWESKDEQAATTHQPAENDEEHKQREWIEKVEREREEAHRMVDEEYDAKEKAEKVKRLLASELTGDASGMTG